MFENVRAQLFGRGFLGELAFERAQQLVEQRFVFEPFARVAQKLHFGDYGLDFVDFEFAANGQRARLAKIALEMNEIVIWRVAGYRTLLVQPRALYIIFARRDLYRHAVFGKAQHATPHEQQHA